jgi:hypothetical protein
MSASSTPETTALATLDRAPTGRDLILQPDNLNAMLRVADLMAKSKNMVPKHLRDNPGGCLAVTMQGMRWNMDPFALAQKTYTVSHDGPVAYEGQAIIAALNNSPLLATRLDFEWFGDWHKIVGKFKEVTSKTKKDDEGNFKKYIVPDWNIADEQGLGVRVWARLVGEKEPRRMELLMTQVRTRNSGLWTEDPKQQIGYLSGRRWGRLHAPDVIMGVYTPDELEDIEPKHMGMVEEIKPAAPTAWPDDIFAQRLPEWRKAIADGRANVDSVIAKANSKHPLTEAQTKAIRTPDATDVRVKSDPATGETTGPTEADILALINKAPNTDELAAAADLINSLSDPGAQKRLNAAFDARADAIRT